MTTSGPEIRALSRPPEREFPDEWYDYATAENFWMQWRFRAFLRQIRDLGLPVAEPLRGIEIGCGNGVLRQQIEGATEWTVDGAEIDRGALEMNPNLRGERLLYDIHDREGSLGAKYDFMVIFDVIEHIEDVPAFLDSALYHLKPGGTLFVNVPALESMKSVYDEVAGHLRRYDRSTLRAELEGVGLKLSDMRYWGMSMTPLLLVRGAFLKGTPKEEVIKKGLTPPGRLAESVLLGSMRLETALFSRPPLGTSLLAAASKPEAAA